MPQLVGWYFKSCEARYADHDKILIETQKISKSGNETQLRYYEAEHPYLRPQQGNARVQLILENVAPLISDARRILEVGAGYGRFTEALVRKGFDITPSDVSPAMLARLTGMSRHLPLLLDIQQAGAQSSSFYEAIVGFHILHHLQDIPSAFRTCYQKLSSGGRIVFVEPNFRNILYYIQLLITPQLKWKAERGVLNIRRRLLLGQLTEAGFTDIQFTRFGYLPDLLLQLKWGWRLEKFITHSNKFAFGSLYLCITARKP